jgi:hypothetical protein
MMLSTFPFSNLIADGNISHGLWISSSDGRAGPNNLLSVLVYTKQRRLIMKAKAILGPNKGR